jgi:hypothetical protein
MTVRRACALLGAAALLAAGCSHRPHPDGGESRVLFLERAPEVLAGPSAAVWAGAGDFAAGIERLRDGQPGLAGMLASRQGRLFYAPGVRRHGDAVPDSEAVFVWDPRTGEGFVASDALQGYAPITNGFRSAGVSVEVLPGPRLEKVSGRDCATSRYRVASASGTESQIDAAIDTGGFPIRLASDGAEGRRVFVVSGDVRRESPPAEWFEPPPGYTRYESASAMVDELLFRESTGRGRRGEGPGDAGHVRGRGRRGRY